MTAPLCERLPPSRTLAVTWFAHRRTTELCNGLGIDLVVLATRLRGPLRYLKLGFQTLTLLSRRRPQIVLVQNPSLVLALLALVLRGLLRYRLIVDAHNEAVEPFRHRQPWIVFLSRWVVRRADLTIVTNRQLAERVAHVGGKPFTLPDRVPTVPIVRAEALAGFFNAVLIATFAPDEPCQEVFAAVEGIDMELYVTGDQSRFARDVASKIPANVHFTGFLDDAAYWGVLSGADAVIDLTLKDNCLVCGAYEALALAKPMLLSANAASLELFGDGAVYTNNTAADIRRALVQLRSQRESLETAAGRKRAELIDSWNASARMLCDVIKAAPSAAGLSEAS